MIVGDDRLVPFKRGGIPYCADVGDVAALARDGQTGKPRLLFREGHAIDLDETAQLFKTAPGQRLSVPASIRDLVPALEEAVRWGHRLALRVGPRHFLDFRDAVPPPRPSPRRSGTPPPSGLPAPKLLCFTIDSPEPLRLGLLFGVSLRQIEEVVDIRTIQRLPGAPGHLLGLTEWRGQAIPVIDLAHALGLGDSAPASRAIIARCTGSGEVRAIPVLAVERTDPTVESAKSEAVSLPLERVRGAFRTRAGDRLLVIPDLDAIL